MNLPVNKPGCGRLRASKLRTARLFCPQWSTMLKVTCDDGLRSHASSVMNMEMYLVVLIFLSRAMYIALGSTSGNNIHNLNTESSLLEL
ncbi:unnamed protein product [Heterobilharzia americana]|nr:unnamed protein product [Heterobilharzia americana]